MNLIQSFRNKQTNDRLLVCSYVLDWFQIKHTKKKLKALLEQHPEYPSLLAMKDVLAEYGVESAAIRKRQYAYSDFETPFVCVIQQPDWEEPKATLVTEADDQQLEFLNPAQYKIAKIPVSEFEKIDKEIVLLLDAEGKKDEVDYGDNHKSERKEQLINRMPIYFLLSAVLFTGTYLSFSYVDNISWIALSFLLTSFIGLGITALLVWHEIDADNPFIKEVCGGQGLKINCHAVLASKGSKFLGVSWSIWGFVYFSTFFASQLLFLKELGYSHLWSFISLIVTPYIAYSMYYQWRIVKQWCPLCVGTQCVLFINAILAIVFFANDNVLILQWYSVYCVLMLGIVFFILAYKLVPLIKRARDSREYERRWKRLRYNPDIFQSLLAKSDTIGIPMEGLGIVVGNPEARHEIVKVCNPYCGPCSKAHPELEYILKQNKDVKVRIVFTATGEDNDSRTAPVAHLLAIEEVHGSDKVHIALDDWYTSEIKDYELFAQKYPMNEELKGQKTKIRAMADWCEAMKIRATPTIYINGRELPDGYAIDELKNFF